MSCSHEYHEREASIADGFCPICMQAELKRMRPVYRAVKIWEREYHAHQFPREWNRSFEQNLALVFTRAEKARKK